MAKSTFSGPVRSEDTFKTVSKAASTGTITEVITLGDGPVHWEMKIQLSLMLHIVED